MGFQNAGLGAGGPLFSKIDVNEILSYDKILWLGCRIGCSGATNFFVLSYDSCSPIFWDSKSKNLENWGILTKSLVNPLQMLSVPLLATVHAFWINEIQPLHLRTPC